MCNQQNNIITALSPMRGITSREFCDIFQIYGEPDIYVTEFLRVHETSSIDKNIEKLLVNRTSAKPMVVQLLGRDSKEFVRIAKILESYRIDGIDLNFGCPMPKINKKGVGGALLDEPKTMENIIFALKNSSSLPISAKIRTGFSDSSKFNAIISILSKYDLRRVTIHARTVRGLYREPPNFDHVKIAKCGLNCEVLANGDINSAEQAIETISYTGCDGVMIGRAAIRNPFIFRQIKEITNFNYKKTKPTLMDMESYIIELIHLLEKQTNSEAKQICGIKKFLNFIGQCIDGKGKFLHLVRRVTTKKELFATLESLIKSRANEFFHEKPYENVVARPNCE